jgi:peroxiredoxin
MTVLLALQIQGVAPQITGFAIQGVTVNLNSYKGKNSVLVVFYRTQG